MQPGSRTTPLRYGGIRKNLILLDFFVYGRKFEPYFERAKTAGKAKARKE